MSPTSQVLLLLGSLMITAPPEEAPPPEVRTDGAPADEAPAEEAPAEEAPPEDTPAQAAPDPCIGRQVVELALEGCAGLPCGELAVRRQLFSLSGFRETAAPLRPEQRGLGLARLLKTGYFESVTLRCVPKLSGGQKVTLVVQPNRFVRSVEVEGNEFFREHELSKFIFLRSGSILNVRPGHEHDNEDVQRLIETLKNAYRREGLENVDIRVSAEPVDDDLAFDLTVHITERPRDRLREVTLRHDQQYRPRPGEEPCPRVSDTLLADLVELSVGDVVTKRDKRQIRKRLETFFRSIGYVQPRVVVEAEGSPPNLSVVVETRQCWLLRIWQRDARSNAAAKKQPAFRFPDTYGLTIEELLDESGFRRKPFDDWREALPFVESGVFHYEEALRGVEKITGALQARGYLFAEVRMEHQRYPRSPDDDTAAHPAPVLGTIDYAITLNYERRLQKILFLGARSVPAEELLEQMDTKVYDFFEPGGVVRVDQLLFDLTKLGRYYRARGFYDFAFALTGSESDVAPRRSLVEDGDWLVWEFRFRDRGFRVKKRKSDLGVRVEIPVIEGPRTRIRNVALVDNAYLPPEQALELLGLVGGGRYGPFYLEQGLKRLRAWYKQRGYHRARINVTCEAFDPEPWDGLCDASNVRSRAIDLVVSIDEGERSHVGELFVRGNFKTDREVLVRDLPGTGEPYDEVKVDDATRKLRNLGIFSSVKVEPIGIDEEPPRDEIALVVVVEEAPVRFIDLATGFRTIDREGDEDSKAPAWLGSIIGNALANSDRSTTGLPRAFQLSLPDVLLSAEVEYLDLNFRGLGHRLRVPLRYGISFTDPLRLISFTPSVEAQRVFDSDLRMTFQLVAEVDHVTDQLDRTELGVTSKLTWPIRKDMSLQSGLAVSVICFEEPSLSRLCFENVERAFKNETMISQEGIAGDLKGIWTPQVSPHLSWRYDTQDNPLNPTEGWVVSLSLKYILGFDQNALENNADLDARSFLKWEASVEGAYETRVGIILAGFIRYGGGEDISAEGAAERLLPFNERYTLGGTNGLRGFGDHEVGRYESDGSLKADILDASDDGGGNVVLNANLEARIPLFRSIGIWGAIFFDVGALARRHNELHLASFRPSLGLGIRYLLGDQIPIRLDVAFPLDGTRCIEWGTEANATADQCARREDPSTFHFDLLYSF